ncbi:MAG TPA: acyl-ACP--UDP-N-acetylglucosamine O-acyltransferase [Opitutaceae bacterium]|jgi:UDP-N-acetylglucosamine acyltransferase
MPTSIHPLAIVEPGAQLGEDCEIHPYAIVKRWARLGDRVVVHPFSVVGGDPQDLKFAGEESYAEIGSDTRIRETVTVNRGTGAGGATRVGAGCLLMACCHVAHDCDVGDDVVIANAVLLAGHVTIGPHAILGGGAAFHQFVRVGERTMVSGGMRCSLDLPPFSLAAERDEIVGLNLVGLKRSGLPRETIREIKDAYRAIYLAPGNFRERAAGELASGRYTTAEGRQFLEFFAGGKRGFARARRATADEPSE